MNDLNNNSDKMLALQVVMTEFNALRSEQLYNFDFRHKIVSLLVTTITAIVGVVVYKDDHFVLLLLIPLISTVFGYQWAVAEESVQYIGSYVKHEIEKKVSALISDISGDNVPNYKQFWMGWESYIAYMQDQVNIEKKENTFLDRLFHTFGWSISHYLTFVGSSAMSLFYYIYQVIIIGRNALSMIDTLILIDIVLIILLFIRLHEAEKIRFIIEAQLGVDARNGGNTPLRDFE